MLVFIGIGCNLGDRSATIDSAVAALRENACCTEVVCSSIYETDPMGPQDQPDYLNAVASFQTSFAAHELLGVLQEIERIHGRVRTGTRWGARTLDLDLLLYGNEVIDSPSLTVPHAGIADRSFVLWPLAELAPELIIPKHGNIAELLTQCRQFGIRQLNS